MAISVCDRDTENVWKTKETIIIMLLRKRIGALWAEKGTFTFYLVSY